MEHVSAIGDAQRLVEQLAPADVALLVLVHDDALVHRLCVRGLRAGRRVARRREPCHARVVPLAVVLALVRVLAVALALSPNLVAHARLDAGLAVQRNQLQAVLCGPLQSLHRSVRVRRARKVVGVCGSGGGGGRAGGAGGTGHLERNWRV